MKAKEMFQSLATIFSSGDVSVVESLFAADYVDHQRPDWIKETGPEEFKAIVKLARDNMPNLSVTIEGSIIADNDMVAGRMMWLSDAQKRETIEILRISDGKFVEHWGAKSWSQDLSSSEK